MKDVYELLNDINLDENEFEEMEVSEFEKERIIKSLKKSIKKKKVWRKGALATAIVASLSVVTIGLTFPTYASNIPVIGDIFRFLDNGRSGFYDDYKEYSNEINMTKESNGIQVTINDAIYDGNSVTLTSTIESDQDLGNEPIIFDFLDIKGSNGVTGSSKISKVDEHHYVGLFRATGLGSTDERYSKGKMEYRQYYNPGKEGRNKRKLEFFFLSIGNG